MGPDPQRHPTTVKVSVGTRERIRSFGGATHEETITEALDALEAVRFWSRAEEAAAWRDRLVPAERERLAARDARVDGALEDIG